MIEASRSYEARSYATRRSHLMEVVRSPAVRLTGEALACVALMATGFLSLLWLG